jgi:hypothetical protein
MVQSEKLTLVIVGRQAALITQSPTNPLTHPLFHPRQQNWDDAFEWRGIRIHGKTAMGQTTVRVLHMNSEDQLALRSV